METKNKLLWKDVVGYEGLYLVSNHGMIRSLARTTTSGGIIKQIKQSSGHSFVGLSKDGKEKHHLISRLVLQAFVGPCPNNMECCHNDGNPDNDHVSNLRWDTHKNNMADMKIHGTFSLPPVHFGSDNNNAKLNKQDVVAIKKLLSDNTKIAKIAKSFGVHITTIYRIRNEKTWRNLQNAT